MKRTNRPIAVSCAAATFLALAGLTFAASPVPLVAPVAGAAVGQGAASAPIVEISKKCRTVCFLNRDAVFEIDVTNRGGGPASNVTVSDEIVGGTTFVSADNGGSHQGNKVVWNLASLPAGETRALKVTVRCMSIGPVKNTATVSYCVTAMAQCEMQIKGIPGVLLEVVDESDPIEVNTNETYTITVTNQGTAEDTNIKIVCEIPKQMSYVSSEGATKGTADGNTVTFAPLPRLAPKERATFKVVCKGIDTAGNDTADVRFKTIMTTDQTVAGGPVTETESTHIYE